MKPRATGVSWKIRIEDHNKISEICDRPAVVVV